MALALREASGHEVIKMEEELKKELLGYAKRMEQMGLVVGTSGNISVRKGETVAIKPSSVDYGTMSIDDIVLVDLEGNVVEGERNPSSELKMHLAVYRSRPNVGAVVHTHSKYASVLAVLGTPILPVLDEVVNYFGGSIECSKYGMPGSSELAKNAVEALAERNGVLLSHHGALACGKDLKSAFENAVRLERVAEIFVIASSIGKPESVPDESIDVEKDIFDMMNI
jgi:L-fuculose-phosphate aldolase